MTRVVLTLEIETTETLEDAIIRHAISILQNADPEALVDRCQVIQE